MGNAKSVVASGESLDRSITTPIAISENTRVYHWVERCGQLVPCFMALIATTDLVVMNEAVQEALADSKMTGAMN